MKMTGFYYLEYPDCSPANPLVAASEVYVEVASQDGSLDRFDDTYSITVCTAGYLKNHLASHRFYAGRSLVVVDRFDDQYIKNALEEMLPDIEKWGLRKP